MGTQRRPAIPGYSRQPAHKRKRDARGKREQGAGQRKRRQKKRAVCSGLASPRFVHWFLSSVLGAWFGRSARIILRLMGSSARSWVALARLLGVSAIPVRRLVCFVGSARAFFAAASSGPPLARSRFPLASRLRCLWAGWRGRGSRAGAGRPPVGGLKKNRREMTISRLPPPSKPSFHPVLACLAWLLLCGCANSGFHDKALPLLTC